VALLPIIFEVFSFCYQYPSGSRKAAATRERVFHVPQVTQYPEEFP